MCGRKNILVQICASKIILPKLQVLLDPRYLPLGEQTLAVMLCKRMSKKGYINIASLFAQGELAAQWQKQLCF